MKVNNNLKKYILYTLLVIAITISSCKKTVIVFSEEVEETPSYTDIELMDMVQEDVFNYFWDYTPPKAKLTRERLHEDDLAFDQNIITTGGSGFGFLNILMGIENQYVTKIAGV